MFYLISERKWRSPEFFKSDIRQGVGSSHSHVTLPVPERFYLSADSSLGSKGKEISTAFLPGLSSLSGYKTSWLVPGQLLIKR